MIAVKQPDVWGQGRMTQFRRVEKKRYLDHLNELRRVNLGDDTSDSAGYGLYLIRMPVSVQPGTSTQAGWGASITATARHEFGPEFLPETFRNLVVNDLVDQLGPIAYERIRDGGYREPLDRFEGDYQRLRAARVDPTAAVEGPRDAIRDCVDGLKVTNVSPAWLGGRTYPVAPGDIANVFLAENLGRIAREADAHLRTRTPRGLDVRSHIRQEIEAAYDLIAGDAKHPGPLADAALIAKVGDAIRERGFEGSPKARPTPQRPAETNRLEPIYRQIIALLPGDLEQRGLEALCWAIAVDASLLNRQLGQDMRRLAGTRGFAPPSSVDTVPFYLPTPSVEADMAFRDYVRARWPLVVFALDPVADQQNIADAALRRRDMQLALATSVATGQVGLGGLARMQRRVEAEVETIALNRTISAFAFGNEHFGWKFTPRYQTPKGTASQLRAGLDALAGREPEGPMRDARLDAGQRELTAALAMPSFLNRVRVEVAGRGRETLADEPETLVDRGH